MIPDELRGYTHHDAAYPVPPTRRRYGGPARQPVAADSLFPAPYESDADRIEGLRTMRGIAIGVVAGTAFWLSALAGALIAWWLS